MGLATGLMQIATVIHKSVPLLQYVISIDTYNVMGRAVA
jgi:hypothetical protein